MVAVGLRCVCLLRGMERWLAVFCEGLSVLVLLVVLLVVLLHGMHVGVSVVGLFGLADLLGFGVPCVLPLDACALAASSLSASSQASLLCLLFLLFLAR